MKQRGFTVIEMLVVVGIIAILAALAIPQYQRFTYKSMRVEAVLTLDYVSQAQLAYFSTADEFATGSIAPVNQKLGLGSTGTTVHKWSFASYGKRSGTECVSPGEADKACGYTVALTKDLDRKGPEAPEYRDWFRITYNSKSHQDLHCPIDQPYLYFDDILNRYVNCL